MEIRRAEAADDGLRDIDEVAVMHPEAVGVCSGIEHHFGIADETLLYEDTLEVETTEWRHRAFFAIGIELCDLAFGRKPKRRRAGEVAQLVELNCVMRGKDGQDDFAVGDADHRLGP